MDVRRGIERKEVIEKRREKGKERRVERTRAISAAICTKVVK
jgi:hypothetical protein